MIIFVKLILAHLIADFILQPKSWIQAKENEKIKAWQLYLHAFVHGFLSFLFIWQINFIKFAILIALIHLIIDIFKIYTQRESTKCLIFFLDQALHLLSLGLIWIVYQGINIDFDYLLSQVDFLILTFLIWLSKPASIVIKMLITKWTEPIKDERSLQNAGEFIGILERLLIFIFIVSNHWEGVGFLLAAKSIFRFGDLKDPKDRNLTEYILIGTLLSFGIAVVSGISYLFIK